MLRQVKEMPLEGQFGIAYVLGGKPVADTLFWDGDVLCSLTLDCALEQSAVEEIIRIQESLGTIYLVL